MVKLLQCQSIQHYTQPAFHFTPYYWEYAPHECQHNPFRYQALILKTFYSDSAPIYIPSRIADTLSKMAQLPITCLLFGRHWCPNELWCLDPCFVSESVALLDSQTIHEKSWLLIAIKKLMEVLIAVRSIAYWDLGMLRNTYSNT